MSGARQNPGAWPPAGLAALREADLAASSAVLGVAEHGQLGYPDDGCAGAPAGDAIDRLGPLIAHAVFVTSRPP